MHSDELWTSEALHVWLYADSMFALKHHQAVDSVTSICFCILKASPCGEPIEKRQLPTEAITFIDSYHHFCMLPFFFHFYLLLKIKRVFFTSFLTSISFLSSVPCSFPIFCDPYPPALLLLLCGSITGVEKLISPPVQMQVWKIYRG